MVRARAGHLLDAERLIVSLGGDVTRVLPIIDGVAATIDASHLSDLTGSSSIVAVTTDGEVSPMSVDPTLGYDPSSMTSMSSISQITGAQSMWNLGWTGQGVDIALIDTGIARVPGLDRAGKVIDGPDLSFDSQEPTLTNIDAFGHGTHMAGIIAGSDVAPGTSGANCKTCLGKSAYTDVTKFEGIAPDARLINVKVGAYDGAADVSQVIAGIDWVVQHAHDRGFNIRVINLSFGTDTTQDPLLDPLVFAAEQAWNAGIVVVAASGNDGRGEGPLAAPAVSPSVIAVGASDPHGSLDIRDDKTPSFSQRGDDRRRVDLVAPGVSVISLRVPGGFVDQNVTTGKVGTRFQQASGTSQSTAVVSGLAALLISKYPTARPDEIKNYLTANALGIKKAKDVVGSLLDPKYAGYGEASVAGNGSTSFVYIALPVPTRGTGLGSLEASRGTYHVSNGVADLTGEKDIFGQPWNAPAMATLTAARATWKGGVWNGARWSGDNWSGARWSGALWTSNDWTGARWSGARWSSMIWDGARWSGARWSGARWSSGTWDGARWSGARWSDDGWS